MKRTILLTLLGLSLTMQAQQKVYTLSDWNLQDWDAGKGELALDVSEYKLDFNHPLSRAIGNTKAMNGYGPSPFPKDQQPL